MHRFHTVAAALAFAAVFAWPPPAGATVMVEVPLDRLVAEADAIVLGRVDRIDVEMVPYQGGLDPHTLASVRVDRWLKGAGARAITVRELGGVHGNGGMWIDGTPRYRAGEEVVLFLVRHPERPGDYRTYGMAQGKLVVRRGVPGTPDVAHRDLEGIAFARWTDGAMHLMHADGEPAMQLGELLAFVERRAAHVTLPPTDSLGGAR